MTREQIKLMQEEQVAQLPQMRFVACTFYASSKRYTYKILDPDVQVGDLVVVKTQARFEIVTVRAVLDSVDLGAYRYGWAIYKIKEAAWVQLETSEDQALDLIQESALEGTACEPRTRL